MLVTNADYSNSGLALDLLRVCTTRVTVLSCVLWGMAIIHMILQMGLLPVGQSLLMPFQPSGCFCPCQHCVRKIAGIVARLICLSFEQKHMLL